MKVINDIKDITLTSFIEKCKYYVSNNNSDNILEYINIDKLINFVLTNNVGFIVNNENDSNYYFSIFIDVGLLGSLFSEELLYSLLTVNGIKHYKDSIKKDIAFFKKEIYDVCPTTFFYITNVLTTEIFEDYSPVKAVLDSYPCYNVIGLSSYNATDDEIDEGNEQRTYSFYSNLRHIQNILDDKFYFNFMDKIESNISNDLFYYRISRYPDLLEFYDDYRNQTISMILPVDNPLSKIEKYKETEKQITLKGFKVLDKTCEFFTSDISNECSALFYPEVEFTDFFNIECRLDLFHVLEGAKVINIDDKTYQCLFFWSKEFDESYVYESNIRQNTSDHIYEDRMVADIYTTIPIRYESLEYFNALKTKENNFIANNVITGLRFQENYEFGNENHNVRKYQDRMLRYDLGSINIYLAEESHYNYYRKTKPILSNNQPISVRLIVAVDMDTHTGVLYMLNFGSKGKPSDYINSISSNNIFFAIDNNLDDSKYVDKNKVKYALDEDESSLIGYLSLYTYLSNKYKIKKMGMPRHMILSPFLGDEKEDDSAEIKEGYKSIKASLLYAETLFDEAEELGQIVDPLLDTQLKQKYGQSIYNYSSTYISRSTILQYGDTYKDYLIERIDFGVVNLFYMELVVLEDAAVQIATSNISRFINNYSIKGTKSDNKYKVSTNNILDTFDEIQQEYAKTLDFWDIQMNYLSSKVFLNSIRKKFDIQKSVDQLKRIRVEIETIYQSKNDKEREKSDKVIAIVGALLTIVNIVDVYENEEELQNVGNGNLFSLELFLIRNLSTLDVIRLAMCVIILFFLVKYIIKKRDENNINKQ